MQAFARSLVFGLLPALALAACATRGRVEGGRYYSPAGNFDLPYPTGTRTQEDHTETGGYVTFLSLFGASSTVTYDLVPPEIAALFLQPDRREETYRSYFREAVMPNIFYRFSPQTSIEHEEFLPADGALFAVVRVPEGHTSHVDPKTMRRLDSIRCLLIFGVGDSIYMLAEESKWPSDVLERLREMRASMAFKPSS